MMYKISPILKNDLFELSGVPNYEGTFRVDVFVRDYYVSEKGGSDSIGDGSEQFPFKTLRRLFESGDMEAILETKIYVDGEGDDGERWMEIPKTRLKKAAKNFRHARNKAANSISTRPVTAADFVVIKEDTLLPKATRAKIRDLHKFIGKRVQVYGWAHRIRRQTKKLMFIILRDGTGLLQCLLAGDLPQTADGLTLSTESSLFVKGVVAKVPEGQKAPGDFELQVDYWEVVGKAPAGGVEAVVSESSEVDLQFDMRHLMIRTDKAHKILMLVAMVSESFREHYRDRGFTEVDFLFRAPFNCVI